MILKLYKQNIIIGLFLIPLISIVVCLPVFYTEIKQVFYYFNWETNLFYEVTKIKWLNFVLTLTIILFNSIMLNRVFNKTTIFSKQTFIPSLIYLIVLSFSPTILFTPELVLQLLVILTINQLIKLDQNKEVIHFIFKAGLFIGITICFSPYYISFVVGLLIVLLNFKLFSFKDWLGIFLGVSIPLIYLFSSMFLFTNSIDYGHVSDYIEFNSKNQLVFYIQLGLLGFILLAGLLPLRKFYVFAISDIKKQVYLLIILFFIGIVASFIAYTFFLQTVFPFIVPLSLLLTVSVINQKDDTFISLLLTLALIVNIVALYLG